MARTRDHSKVENLVALGLLQPHQQEQHPERNKVLNCLGSPFEPTIEISRGAELLAGRLACCCAPTVSGRAVPEIELCRRIAAGPVERGIPELVRRRC